MVSHPVHGGWIAGIPALVEIIIITWTIFVLCRKSAFPIAEAAAYALAGTLMALSLMFQTSLILGIPEIATAAETILVLVCAVVVIRLPGALSMPVFLVAAWRRHRLAFGVLLALFSIAAARSMAVAPPAGLLDAIWPLQGGETLKSLASWLKEKPDLRPALLNHRILVRQFLQFGTTSGTAFFNFMAYLIIGFSTYALSRRYAWPPTAMTSAMIVLSFPRLIFLSSFPGNELVSSAMGVFSLLALYRTVEQPGFSELALLGWAISFTVSSQPMGWIFPLILGALSFVVLYRRHGGRIWWQWITAGNPTRLLAFIPLLIFSQIWLVPMLRSLSPGSDEIALTARFTPNGDGLASGFANMARYVLPAMDPSFEDKTPAVGRQVLSLDRAVKWMTGHLGMPPASHGDSITSVDAGQKPTTPGWWFGPLSFLLVAPSLLFALVKGPRRLKAVAVALTGYLYLAALLPAWNPDNAVYITPLFSSAGYMTAFFLPPWRFTRLARRCLQTLCAGIMMYSIWVVFYG